MGLEGVYVALIIGYGHILAWQFCMILGANWGKIVDTTQKRINESLLNFSFDDRSNSDSKNNQGVLKRVSE